MKMRKFLLVFGLVFVLLMVPVVAQAQGPAAPSFSDWLILLSGPGLGAAVAAAVSLLAENWAGYQNLAPRLKSLLYMAVCLVIGLGSASLRAAMGYVQWSWDPLLWQALWNALAQYGVGRLGRDLFWKYSLRE